MRERRPGHRLVKFFPFEFALLQGFFQLPALLGITGGGVSSGSVNSCNAPGRMSRKQFFGSPPTRSL